MIRKSHYLIFFVFLMILSSIACTIESTKENVVVTLTPIPTLTCTPTTIPVTPTPKIGTVNVSIALNLRESPTENSKSLYLLKNGDKLDILGVESNGWLCVNFSFEGENGEINTILGYVNPKFVD